MGDDYWQTTAQMFSSLFEKPKMTEKLLQKPPFKYLFDIVLQTTKSSGWGKGLYNEEELSADFYDTKEKKIYFLRKVITLTGVMLKEEIEAKPNKIVAGVEPDKTNFFLQAMYRAAVSGEDSGPFVKKILAKFAKEEAEGGSKGGDEETKPAEKPVEKREEPKEKPQEKKPAREEAKKEPTKEQPKPREDPKPAAKPKVDKPEERKPVQKEPEKPQPQPPAQSEKLQRPGTASKKPPNTKSNVQVVEDTRQTSGPSGIIRDDPNNKKDDDDMFETKPQASTKINTADAEKHGAFVKKALEDVQQEDTNKEEQTQGGSKIRMGNLRNKKNPQAATQGESSKDTAAGPNAAGASQNEVEVIQKLIQSLTQNINPLRKSIDFINDDIESMNKEMDFWRSQYINSKAKYQLELANTEEQLQPLQNKLAELEEQIKDKKYKIQATKSSILQNEQKIQKLLYSVVSSKQ